MTFGPVTVYKEGSPGGSPPLDDARTSDLALVRRFKGGEEEAFEALVHRYRSRVYSTVYHILRDRHEAEDLAQEVFTRTYFALASFREESSFSTWIYRITVNLCLNRLKFLRRRSHGSLEEVSPRQISAASPSSPERVAMDQEMERALERAIGGLSDSLRVPFVLHEVQGLPYEEMRTLLGVGVGALKTRVYRARRILQSRLDPYLRAEEVSSP